MQIDSYRTTSALHSHPKWKSAIELIIENDIADFAREPILEELIHEKWNKFARKHYWRKCLFPYFFFLATYCSTLVLRAEELDAESSPSFPDGLVNSVTVASNNGAPDFTDVFVNWRAFVSLILHGILIALWMPWLMWTGFRSRHMRQTEYNTELVFKNLTLIFAYLTCLCIVLTSVARGTEMQQMERVSWALGSVVCALQFLVFIIPFQFFGFIVISIWKMLVGDVVIFVLIYALLAVAFSLAVSLSFVKCPSGIMPPHAAYATTMPGTILFEFWTGLDNLSLDDLADYSRNLVGTQLFHITFIMLFNVLGLNLIIAMMGKTFASSMGDVHRTWIFPHAVLVLRIEKNLSDAQKRDCNGYRCGTSGLANTIDTLALQQDGEDEDEIPTATNSSSSWGGAKRVGTKVLSVSESEKEYFFIRVGGEGNAASKASSSSSVAVNAGSDLDGDGVGSGSGKEDVVLLDRNESLFDLQCASPSGTMNPCSTCNESLFDLQWCQMEMRKALSKSQKDLSATVNRKFKELIAQERHERQRERAGSTHTAEAGRKMQPPAADASACGTMLNTLYLDSQSPAVDQTTLSKTPTPTPSTAKPVSVRSGRSGKYVLPLPRAGGVGGGSEKTSRGSSVVYSVAGQTEAGWTRSHAMSSHSHSYVAQQQQQQPYPHQQLGIGMQQHMPMPMQMAMGMLLPNQPQQAYPPLYPSQQPQQQWQQEQMQHYAALREQQRLQRHQYEQDMALLSLSELGMESAHQIESAQELPQPPQPPQHPPTSNHVRAASPGQVAVAWPLQDTQLAPGTRTHTSEKTRSSPQDPLQSAASVASQSSAASEERQTQKETSETRATPITTPSNSAHNSARVSPRRRILEPQALDALASTAQIVPAPSVELQRARAAEDRVVQLELQLEAQRLESLGATYTAAAEHATVEQTVQDSQSQGAAAVTTLLPAQAHSSQPLIAASVQLPPAAIHAAAHALKNCALQTPVAPAVDAAHEALEVLAAVGVPHSTVTYSTPSATPVAAASLLNSTTPALRDTDGTLQAAPLVLSAPAPAAQPALAPPPRAVSAEAVAGWALSTAKVIYGDPNIPSEFRESPDAGAADTGATVHLPAAATDALLPAVRPSESLETAKAGAAADSVKASRVGMKKVWAQEVMDGGVLDVERWVPDNSLASAAAAAAAPAVAFDGTDTVDATAPPATCTVLATNGVRLSALKLKSLPRPSA